MSKENTKKCVDCSMSQQIKCFGIAEVNKGISKNRKCKKKHKSSTPIQT